MLLRDISILAITQGLTEFLPVSSSGHLVLVRHIFGISDTEGTVFDAFLHLGTVVALLVYYWRVWWGILKGFVYRNEEAADKRQLFYKLVVATIPGVIAGLIYEKYWGDAWRSLLALAVGFLITAVMMAIADRLTRVPTKQRASFRDAIWIGLAQILALPPAISRSGSTISAGRLLGLSKEQATNFSFLMSAPIIAGAGVLGLRKLFEVHEFTAFQLSWGFLLSFVSGLLAIHWCIKIIKKVSLTPFIVYLVLLAVALLYVNGVHS